MRNLTKKDLQILRNEIVLNSLYYDDYINSFGIDKKECCDFFDGYLDYLYELADEDNKLELFEYDFFSAVKKYDTIDNLQAWYLIYVSY